MRQLLQSAGTIQEVLCHELEVRESFSSLAARCWQEPGTVLLRSGGPSDCARYDLLALRPWLSLRGRGESLLLRLGPWKRRLRMDPFDALDTLRSAFALPDAQPGAPVRAGLFGYLAYDLKDRLERLPKTCLDDLGLPELCLFAPSALLVRDRLDGACRLHMPKLSVPSLSDPEASLAWIEDLLQRPAPEPAGFAADSQSFRSSFRESDYLQAVRAVREYILDGHAYQVNLSQRFSLGFSGSPFALFCNLFASNPAAFFAFINAGDHQIVSTSPERFLALRGVEAETRPIKGTRPRGRTPAEDRALLRELQTSQKDDAELSMIVDLLRNDLGKVCQAGTVRVEAHKRAEAYTNVFHLVSVVSGKLREGAGAVDLLRAAFPGGSITGCPKIRSLEIIDELEPVRRHIYTGSIGYIGFGPEMDLSVAIRTAIVHRGLVHFAAGGGIVADSAPRAEYQETLDKGRTFMEVLGAGALHGDPGPPKPKLWFDGRLVPADEARVLVLTPGLQYGFGHFETLRADAGRVHFLDEHLARFERTWRALYSGAPPDLTWEAIIAQVLEANGLEAGTAAIKILACKGRGPLPGCHLAVSASGYVHRLEQLGKPGLDLAIYPEPRQTPLAEHKSLNYLFSHLAGEWARARGADEALILNPDGTVSESNSASILLITGSQVLVPASKHVLRGVTAERTAALLLERGFSIVQEPVRPEQLLTSDLVILTNALIGAAAVHRLEGRALSRRAGITAAEIRACLFGPVDRKGVGRGRSNPGAAAS